MKTTYASPREMPTTVTHHVGSIMSYIPFSPIAQCQQTASKFLPPMVTTHTKVSLKQNFPMDRMPKESWLKGQGYDYEANPTGVPPATITARQETVRRSAQPTLYGKIATDYFSCEKHLTIGVEL